MQIALFVQNCSLPFSLRTIDIPFEILAEALKHVKLSWTKMIIGDEH
jgi:hypothetical protein